MRRSHEKDAKIFEFFKRNIKIEFLLSFPVRMHGKCGATYESGSLRRYRFGRTETIRSCTNEALQFSRTFSSKSKEKSFELFSRAIKAQREYTNDVRENFRILLANSGSFSRPSTPKGSIDICWDFV